MRNDRFAEHDRGDETNGSGPILASRVPILSSLAEAWADSNAGMRLLTGAAGTGKSWLWRNAVTAARSLRTDLHWVWVPHWPDSRDPDLMHALSWALEDNGLPSKSSVERSYLRAELKIREIHEDGFGVRVVIEEAHNLNRQGFESIRILAERLRPIGVDFGVLFVGRTSVLRRFHRHMGDPRPAGWNLKHISLPETLDLLNWFGGAKRSWSRSEADWIHREALGNPRRIIRWAENLPADTWGPDKSIPKPGFGHDSGSKNPPMKESAELPEPLIPARPPLTESEGVIEVGYEDETEDFVRIDEAWASGVYGGAIGDEILTEETFDTASSEAQERKTKYRMESGEGFAPYGISASRSESPQGKTPN